MVVDKVRLTPAVVRELKFECRLHNVQFNKAMNDLGYTPKVVKQIEAGSATMDLDDFEKLVKKYDIELHSEVERMGTKVNTMDLVNIINAASDDLTSLKKRKMAKSIDSTVVSDVNKKARLKLANVFTEIAKTNELNATELSYILFNSAAFISSLKSGSVTLTPEKFEHAVQELSIDTNSIEYAMLKELMYRNLTQKYLYSNHMAVPEATDDVVEDAVVKAVEKVEDIVVEATEKPVVEVETSADVDVAYARNRVGQIISQVAFVNNISIAMLADRAGVETEEMVKICNGTQGISIYHALRLEEVLNFSVEAKRELEKYAAVSQSTKIPAYVEKYIQNATVAKVLAKCAESKMPTHHFELLLRYCK